MFSDTLLSFFQTYPEAAWLLSILASVFLSLLAVVPSTPVTAANLAAFGFWEGLILSLIGEAVGAGLCFLLYRKGLRRYHTSSFLQRPSLHRLSHLQGWRAAFMVLALRLFPLAPSGLVTLAGALSGISWPLFLLSSTLGKAPALFLEAGAVYYLLDWGWQGMLLIGAFSVLCMVPAFRAKPPSRF